jgi:uncharacterized protein YdeI (YjbR/CyaY-like superfamily)
MIKSSLPEQNNRIAKTIDYQIIAFVSQIEFSNWMDVNHNETKGIWIRFYKKNSGTSTVTYDEALDIALCYGWIDGQVKKFDGNSYLQKFTPRRSKSMWSKRNKDHIARLEKEGRMKCAGIREVEAAKEDGRWEIAYDSPGNMEIPQDFIQQISKNNKASEFFATLNKTNLYTIGWRLQTAKNPETRLKRMTAIIEMLEKEQKFH